MLLRLVVSSAVVVSGALVLAAGAPFVPLSAVALQDPPPQRQTQLEAILTPKGYQPKLAIQDFIAPAGDAELSEAAKVIADVLWADLEFEREYSMIDRKLSAHIPVAPTPADLPAERWRALGADAVLVATVRRVGEQFEVDLRAIVVRPSSAGKQEFGKQYQGCTTRNPRACAHYMADDFHKDTRNVDGVAQTRLAFVSDRDAMRVTGRPLQNPGTSKEVYIADYDGFNALRVTANQKLNIAPVWSPDARSLAYTSWETGFQDIYVIHPYRGGPRSRPSPGTDEIHNMLAAWSPDGSKIAFASTRDGRGLDVWVVNADGSGLRNLTPNTPNWDDSAPTWSPDGTQIAFTSDRAGTNQIYLMSAEGTLPKRIVSERHSDRPTWSPLNYIAFSLQSSGAGHDVAVYDLLSQQVRVLTNGLGSNESPSVAPNGRHIAFRTTRFGREQIAILDYPTGGNIRRITTEGNNSYPNWSPAPKR
jgi:TolB protein